MKIDGRCHCGYVTFQAEADPETTTICNCTDCQTMSGAPLRAVTITGPGTFVLLSGKPTEYRKTADSGNVRVQGFCPNAGRRSMQPQLMMSQKPTMCGLERCANEMNWCRAGRYLFARNRRGSTTSTRFRNSTDHGIDPADALRTGVRAAVSCPSEVCYPSVGKRGRDRVVNRRSFISLAARRPRGRSRRGRSSRAAEAGLRHVYRAPPRETSSCQYRYRSRRFQN
jgi:hypothetical protein